MSAGADLSRNVPLAFLLVTVAGLSTAVGASSVFFTKCVSLTNKKFLAASLGFSAGVMLYVSFVEILQKSLGGFEEGGLEGDAGSGTVYLAGTSCLFGGMLIMWGLNFVVHLLDGEHSHELQQASDLSSSVPEHVRKANSGGAGENSLLVGGDGHRETSGAGDVENVIS